MINVAIVGIGRMGSYHLDMYEKLSRERGDVRVVAICDVEPDRLSGKSRSMFNMGKDNAGRALGDYRKYTSVDELLANEHPDIVDVVAPTYLHSEISVKALEVGCNVMCEKPMALDAAQCDAMLEASKKNGKLLMIGQCLHFWREYVYLHETVKSGVYGAVKAATFWRGGCANHITNPSWQEWIITAEKGGGGLFDQHIHDTDFILWTLGKPEGVSSFARGFFPKSRNDIVMTNYIYNNMVISAQDDIAYAAMPFSFGYVVDMEKATAVFAGKLTVYPAGGEPFTPELASYGVSDDAYYNEIDYFVSCVQNGTYPSRCTPESARESVLTALAEAASAEANRESIRSL